MKFRTSSLSAVCLAAAFGAAAMWHFQTNPGPAAVADEPPAEMAHAEALSSAFRWVANKTLPAIVSIESTGTIRRPNMSRVGPDPFDDPFFRQFFGDRIPELQRPQGEQGEPIPQRLGQGSGFLIDPTGVIMTNAHVVRGADEVTVQLSDGREFQASDVRVDDRADIAVMRIDVDEQLPYLPLGDDANAEIGDWVMAFGSPFGLHRSVTQGIVSAKSRGLSSSGNRREFIQTDAAINPGNSGGPLVNLRGEVIGINTAISTASGGYDGVGFAVPISVARWVSDQLLTKGRVQRAYIGVLPQDVDASLVEALSLEKPTGVIVTQVSPDSPAAEAGIQVQDVIIELDGKKITNSRKLVSVAEKLTIGNKYDLKVLRDGEIVTLSFEAAEYPEDLVAAGPAPNGAAPQSRSESEIPELGLQIQQLTPEIAEQLGATVDSGIVITDVTAGSLGQRLGLQPGHIILRIGNQPVSTLDDVAAALEQARERQQVLLLIRTEAGTQFISVPFVSPEN